MYAATEDILHQISRDDLIGLTDDKQVGGVDEAVVTWALTSAGAVIDAHCADRYITPMVPVPELVRLFAVDMALYNLFTRRGHISVPDGIRDRYNQALAYLRRVQDGKAGFGEGLPMTPDSATSQSGIVSGNGRIFTRDRMEGL